MILPPAESIRADLVDALSRAGETGAQRTLGILEVHLRLLALWNPRYRLTRIRTWPEILDRHVRESLLPLRWIGPRGRLLDLGSGNGFPAVPILACRPKLHALLVERSARKALFLDALVREAVLSDVRVGTRDLGPRDEAELEPFFDYVISRATLPPRHYLPLAASWVRPGGRVFLYAGEAARGLLERGACGSELRLLAASPIEGRADSCLLVLEARPERR